MKRSTEPSKIVGLTVGEMKILLGSAGEMTVKATTALQDKDGNVHGRSEFIGPWPKSVMDAITILQNAVEEYLITVHFSFETTSQTVTAPGEDHRPTGLFGSGKDQQL